MMEIVVVKFCESVRYFVWLALVKYCNKLFFFCGLENYVLACSKFSDKKACLIKC